MEFLNVVAAVVGATSFLGLCLGMLWLICQIAILLKGKKKEEKREKIGGE